MAFTEVYTALQTASVDGQDNPLPTVVDAKFYEVTKQIVLTSHLVDLNYIAFSKAVWDELTPQQQTELQAAADAAAASSRKINCRREEELVSFLRQQGLENLYAGPQSLPRACSGPICRLQIRRILAERGPGKNQCPG